MLTRAISVLSAASLFLILTIHTAAAATWTVRKDGTGDFTTINDAKNAATTGDVIEVGPGIYAEEIDFSYAVTLQSTDGAVATILDGEHTRRILIFRAGSGSVVEGFTIRNGTHVSAGGGLRVQLGATATVRNCVFTQNYSAFDGGAVVCRDAGTQLDMFDCLFLDNTADRHAGAALVVEAGTANFTRCRFEGNSGSATGALATASMAVYSVTDCIFLGNSGSTTCIYSFEESTPTIVGNTFVDNPDGFSSVRLLASYVVFRRNIIANAPNSTGLIADNITEVRTCNVYWNLETAAWDGLNPGEAEEDPLFCDPAGGDYSISLQSPAAPAHSACGELIGALPAACNIGPPPPPVVAPVILTILDVPNDQGNQVRIRWERSDYDAPYGDYLITGYAIYRHQGEFLASSKLPSGPRSTGAMSPAIDGWDYIATVPARGDDIYQYVAPTLCNKPKNGDPCWSVFFVSAMTPSPVVYFDSAPDSGYSEDNLPPGPPSAFSVAVTAAGAELDWEAPADGDVVQYRIYRAEGADPIVGPATLIHATSDNQWVDAGGTPLSHYRVSALDENDNEGEAVGPGAITAVDDPVPTRYLLRQNTPNPFNPSTQFAFDVPAGGGRVRIDIFDVAGRRVRTLLDEERAAGVWTVQWDGTTDRGSRASSGVYFYRMRARGFEQTLRMTLLQ